MISEFDLNQLSDLIERQLSGFFPISDIEMGIIRDCTPVALKKAEYCFSKINNKYFHKNNSIIFSPFHSGQWLIFLYYMANTASVNLMIINKWGVE